MLKQRHQLFVTLFGVADVCTVVCACAIAWGARTYRFDDLALGITAFWRDSIALLAAPAAIRRARVIRSMRAVWRLTGAPRNRRPRQGSAFAEPF